MQNGAFTEVAVVVQKLRSVILPSTVCHNVVSVVKLNSTRWRPFGSLILLTTFRNFNPVLSQSSNKTTITRADPAIFDKGVQMLALEKILYNSTVSLSCQYFLGDIFSFPARLFFNFVKVTPLKHCKFHINIMLTGVPNG